MSLPNTLAFASKIDPADILPAAAAAHLEALRQEVSDAHAVLLATSDRLNEQRQVKNDIALRKRQLLEGHRLKPDDPLVVDEDRKTERVAASIAALQSTYGTHQTAWREAAGLLSALDEFVSTLRGKPSLYEGATPSKGKGESLVQAVERCRRRLRELNADKLKYQTAPLPSSNAKQLVRSEIERLAERGRPDLAPVLDHGEPIRWPLKHNFKSERLLTAVGDGEIDALAVMMWALQPQLIAALEKEVDAITDDTSALADTDRAKLLGEVARDMLAVERDEEFFIRCAQAEGVAIRRRSDANPVAVLQLET